jgi:hypothetical protein
MRSSAIVLVLLLSSACGDSPTSPSSGDLTIHGNATAYATGAPRVGSTVLFARESDAIEVTAITTDTGGFVMTLPKLGGYRVAVDGQTVGNALVTGPAYRAELLVGDAQCASRFGTLSDARTMKPVRGATITLGGHTVQSERDGWYRVDMGCNGPMPGGTTMMTITHPDYEPLQQVVGRGISGVNRIDLALDPD